MICDKCFGDAFLSERIRSQAGRTIAKCGYCKAKSSHQIRENRVADMVEVIFDLYGSSTEKGAKPLARLLKHDWGLFPKVSLENAQKILHAIFPQAGIKNKKYKSKQAENDRSALWDEFQQELKHRNRFFPQVEIIDREDLKSLFEWLILRAPPEDYYRSRICDSGVGYVAKEMKSPPPEKAKGGRANPFGISYLYLASDVETAIAEVRPSVGDLVAVAKFSKISTLILLDLRSPRTTISPFEIADGDALLGLLKELDFLCKLGERLTKPVLPKEAELEYLASQYLCELIKHFNYDGVVYKSALGPGINIALFGDEKLRLHEAVTLHSVNAVKYISKQRL